ncbi:MAG TPA: GGDEF domain-containing protein [Thermoleophilaceae bacterium]|nr:GGDEF domain-containing protein [Thermoleophilaceae bacterium]
MNPGRLVRAGTPIEVTVLAIMALVLGVGSLASAAFPYSDDAPRLLVTAFGVFGIALAVVLAFAGPRVTTPALHATVVLLIGLRGVLVSSAITERGLMLSALGFVWTAVYVAFFFRPAIARAYAALMTATFGASLLLAAAPTDASVWLTISAMIWVAILVLTGLNTRLRAEAQSDWLTGLLNRSGFSLAAPRHRAMAARRGESVAIAVIDLDDFKQVNDIYGHAAGDRLLIDLAGAWTASLRPGDLLARFGGDEFVLMFPVASEGGVDTVLARLRGAHPTPWTAGSVLVAPGDSLDDALGRADGCLYAAKRRAGRDAEASPGRPAGGRLNPRVAAPFSP